MKRLMQPERNFFLPKPFDKYKHKSSKWITDDVIKSIRYKDNLYKLLKSTHPESPLYNERKINFRTYSAILNKTINRAKSHYYHGEFYRCKHDMKKTWNIINDLLCRRTKSQNSLTYLEINSLKITQTDDIANHFNNYFAGIGPLLSSTINNQNKTHSDYLKERILCSFSFSLVTPDEVKKIISGFTPKSSSGVDNMSMKLLKRIENAILWPLTLVINQSLTTGIFPDKLKVAKVVPLFKKGNEHLPDNYRPISLLSSISKVFEKVVYDQVYRYFKSNSLFYISQYGYRNDHSTEMACLEFIDRVMHDLDNRKIPIAIFLDLSKAFDTIDHAILLDKLKYYGINGLALSWFESYLNNRTQFVEVDDTRSSSKPIHTGVPQGSILGPLLFIIYINDMGTVSDIFNPISYADDTALVSTISAFANLDMDYRDDVSPAKNSELYKIYEWLCANKLSVNASKTKYMIFHLRQRRNLPRLHLELNGSAIDRVNTFEFLGLTISDTLDWSHHLNKIANKLSKIAGIMSRIKRYISKDILKTIYNSLVLPHLYFSILVWGFDNNRLFKLQKKLVRLICCAKYNAHTDPLFRELGLLKIKDIFELQCAKFYYRFEHDKLPFYFDNFFMRNAQLHGYNTRQRDALHLYRFHLSATGKCIRFHIPNLINNLPRHVKDKINTHSLPGFAHALKQYLISKYDTQCQILNCYICSR